MIPIRVQRKRSNGWKMPDNTVYVGRPSRWGNPFRTDEYRCDEAVSLFRDMMMNLNSHSVTDEVYKKFRLMRDTIKDLQGKNLACWCNSKNPCHADILLEIANNQ